MNTETGSGHGFTKRLPNSPIIPFVNAINCKQATEMAALASYSGAGGVFFTDSVFDNKKNYQYFAEAIQTARQAHPELWVGAYNVGLEAQGAFSIANKKEYCVDGIYVDNATRWARGDKLNMANLEAVNYYCSEVQPEIDSSMASYFGGIAIRTVADIKDPSELKCFVGEVEQYVDVVTTSGPRITDNAYEERLQAVRDGAGHDKMLAIITDGNLEKPEHYLDYLPVANYILLTYGVHEDSQAVYLDPNALNEVIKRADEIMLDGLAASLPTMS